MERAGVEGWKGGFMEGMAEEGGCGEEGGRSEAHLSCRVRLMAEDEMAK